MALFEKEEIEERLLASMKEIRESTVAVKSIVDNHGKSWSKLRGELFNLLTSLRKMEDLLGYIPDFEESSETGGARKMTLMDSVKHWAIKVEELARENIDPKYFEFPYEVEMDIMSSCSSIIEGMDFYIPIVERHLNRNFGSNLTLIHDFVSSSGGYFNGNWAIGVIHLSAMEVTINRKRKEVGLVGPEEDDSSKSFMQRYTELKDYLLERNIDIESEVHSKADVLWNIRNRVMHQGMELDEEFLAMIIKWSRSVISAISGNGEQH